MQDYITLLNEALKMTSVSPIEAQVNDYIECCEHAHLTTEMSITKGRIREEEFYSY
jgi:hypothetical protein